MKTYWCLIITLFILTSQRTVSSQNLYSPYPIIFVHGLIGNDQSWNDLKSFMETNYGFTYGGRMDFCLNQDGDLYSSKLPEDYKDYTNCDLLHPFNKGDIYTINFDVSTSGIPYDNLIQSNQSAIVKQGLAVSDAIKHVLNITGKNKVILVGHSMGGLAIREYLQNQNLWYEPNLNHHVAKICTVGTPHGGSNFDGLIVDPLAYFFNKLDTRSEAVRDLRTSYFPLGVNGIYLFGGIEPTESSLLKSIPFYNWDIDCDGSIGLNIVALNNKTIPTNLAVSCIIGTGDLLGGDGVVSEESANINNYYSTINAETFKVEKTSGLLWHIELTKQIDPIIRGLDEPKDISLAYELGITDITKGFITYQTKNIAVDQDVFKINVVKSGFLTINIAGFFEAGVDSVDLLDNNCNLQSHIEYPFIHNGISKFITTGTYYLRVSGTAKSNSYLNPYTITTKFYESESSIEGIVELEYFIDSDPSFGKGLNKHIPSSNNITENINIPLNNESNGFHCLFIRVKDVKNRWSNTQNIPFYKLQDTALNISKLEYYIDTDPGIGKGINLSIPPTNNVTKSINIPLSNISNGFHVLYIRAKDNNGNWSITNNSVFYKAVVSTEIEKMEYYLDIDPGFNNATPVVVSKDTDVTKSINIDLSKVSKGIHTLYIRAKNVSGKWSLNAVNAFYCMQSKTTNISELEYFFDMDPGFGYGITIPITPATTSITKQFNVDLACLSSGNHNFYVRSKDDLGNWSLVYSKNITVSLVTPSITQNQNILHSNAVTGNQWYNQNGLINGATNQDYVITANGDYYVIVTHAGCSSVKSNTIKVLNTEFYKAEITNSIKMYPNPTSDNFRISGLNGCVNLKLIDINGKEVVTKQVNNNESISISNLPKGLYIVKLTTQNGVIETKVLKN